MAVLYWRMLSADEPPARLIDVTIAEDAEALEASAGQQLERRIDKDVLALFPVTAEHRAITVLLVRQDDALVWRVAAARPMSGQEFETWLGRMTND